MPAGHATRKMSRRGILMGISCLLLMQLNSVQISWSKTDVDYYKLYAHTLVVDFKEFTCLKNYGQKKAIGE
jgi:hypothetical protein